MPDEISSRTRRKNCVCACFRESVHEPSVAFPRKGDVQAHIRANRQSGSEVGPWNLGWQGANDRRTHHSHGKWVQKARSLHRVPPEERLVISELKKVQGLPWNVRAEKLKATIVTQQDKGPSGHRRVYLTTKVVARHGATHGCSGCVGLGTHTEACRVRLEKASADERADPVETPVGPITDPATESQE